MASSNSFSIVRILTKLNLVHFLDYKNGIKRYIVLDTNNREIFINRNVVFYEKIFPYKMAHNYAFENFVQKDFDFLKEPLDHNIDNNNIETEIDMNIDENQRVSDNRDITTLNED